MSAYGKSFLLISDLETKIIVGDYSGKNSVWLEGATF